MNTTTEELAIRAALTAKVGGYCVKLSNRGNPDYGQSPNKPLPGVACGWARVETLQQASRICRMYIDCFDLGGGNWTGGELTTDSGVVLGKVSYNGRIWNVKGQELTH